MVGHTPILSLHIQEESGRVSDVSFPATEGVTIGRGQKADVSVRDGRLSRVHVRLTTDGSVVYITDLGSLNGTEVNQKAIPPHVPRLVSPADEVVIGNTTITVALILPSVRGSTRPISELGSGTVVVLADSCTHPVEMDDLIDVDKPVDDGTDRLGPGVSEAPTTVQPKPISPSRPRAEPLAQPVASHSTHGVAGEAPVRGSSGIPDGMYRFCYNGAMYGPLAYEHMERLKTAEWSGSFDEALLNDLPICSGR